VYPLCTPVYPCVPPVYPYVPLCTPCVPLCTLCVGKKKTFPKMSNSPAPRPAQKIYRIRILLTPPPAPRLLSCKPGNFSLYQYVHPVHPVHPFSLSTGTQNTFFYKVSLGQNVTIHIASGYGPDNNDIECSGVALNLPPTTRAKRVRERARAKRAIASQ